MVSMDQPLIRNNLLPVMMMMISTNEDLKHLLKLDFGFTERIWIAMKIKFLRYRWKTNNHEKYVISLISDADIGDRNIAEKGNVKKVLVARRN